MDNVEMGSPLTPQQLACLANPFYSALTTRQREFGEQVGGVLRYRTEVLPFAGVERAGTVVDAVALARDTDTNFIGVIPEIEADIAGVKRATCLQMARPLDAGFTVPDAFAGEEELGAANADEMVELTSVAFPGYYRRETYKLGRYIGLRVEGQLVAMAGHRTRMPGLREISAVCTRPGFTGRGYAHHLIQRLLNFTPDETPYLHVVSTNARAIAIYDALGFVPVGEVPFLHIPRLAAATG